MSSFYRDLNEHCTNEFFRKFPHYIVPSLNVHSEVDLEIESYSPYSYTKPIPFLPPASVSVEVWAGSDPATDLLRKKLQWKTQLDVQKRYHTSTKKKTNLRLTLKEIISSGSNVWTASPRESYFVELIASDPDSEFVGTYNWYYTGGCLDTLQMNNKHILLTTQGHKNDQLRVIKLNKKKFWKPSLSATTTQLCTPEQPIYQIRGSRDTGYLCVRQHKQSHLYLLTEELELQCIHSTECNGAFTSIDLSPHTAGAYVTVTSGRNIKEWDSCGRNTYKHRVCIDKTLEDKWCSISYSDDPHGLVLADRNSVYMLDKRNKESREKHSLKDEVQLVGECEDISLVFHSCINTHALYICSSHNVLLYDTRSQMKPVQSWKHNLCSPPLISCTVSPQQNEEVICIANQDPGELVTIVNKWNGEVLNFQTYPQGMPNLRDTLLAANNSGLWLNPTVQHRAKLSLTGLAWLPPIASEFTLLSQTSAGDVFSLKQKTHNGLKSAISFTNQSELECLTNWEKMLLEERTSAALKFTSRKSMKYPYEYMKSSRNRLPQYEILEESKRQPWEMSKAQLESYVDLLAPRILDVWEIEDIPEWDESGRNSARAQFFPEHVDKVEAWLTSIPDSRYFKREKKRKTSHKNAPMLTSTPHEYKNRRMECMLRENVCFSKIEENFNETSEFNKIVSQNKKLKTEPKHEFISGF